MLDENLPTFLLRPSTNNPNILQFYFSQWGSEFEPTYTLRHPNPELPASKNRYAAGLYDAHNEDVLFAEVLLIPSWTQPSLSADAIRANGGVPPPPEPILPSEFTIQLYNPDQQITIRQKHGSWNSSPTWEFEMPTQTFRIPSASSIDRSQHDPAGSETTPKLSFKWRKDSKLNKDLVCFLSGKAINPDGSKKKSKEPDITVSIFKGLKEITLYEPNLQRVDIEDLKGFEVVILLGAMVIRDVYFGRMEETFNITKTPVSPRSQSAALVGLYGSSAQLNGHPTTTKLLGPTVPARDPRIPPTDPRSQWEIDAETARLKKQAEAEERLRKKKIEEEQKQIKKMLELEKKERRKKQDEIDRETERLQRIYGQEDLQARPNLPPNNPGGRHHSDPFMPTHGRPHSSTGYHAQQHPQPYVGWPSQSHENSPYLGWPGQVSGFLGSSHNDDGRRVKPRKSLWGLGTGGNDGNKLGRKRSVQF